MNEYYEKREERINALIDGDLGQADADDLKAAASDDRELARAIVEAYQLQQVMETVHIERVPSRLAKRLKAIPRQHRSRPVFSFLQPRWAMALAVIPLVAISISLMQPKAPSADAIAQARQDMALAFAYLDKAGVRTGRQIGSSVGHTLADAITGSVNRTIKSQSQSFKEHKA